MHWLNIFTSTIYSLGVKIGTCPESVFTAPLPLSPAAFCFKMPETLQGPTLCKKKSQIGPPLKQIITYSMQIINSLISLLTERQLARLKVTLCRTKRANLLTGREQGNIYLCNRLGLSYGRLCFCRDF